VNSSLSRSRGYSTKASNGTLVSAKKKERKRGKSTYTNLGRLASCSSAFSSLVIFSAMFACTASAIGLLARDIICAANFATLLGFMTYALEEPGGFVRQVSFMKSGGQLTTGKLAE